MMKWYSKYLSIYGVDFGQVKPEIVTEIRRAVDAKRCESPEVSVVVIAHNEARRIAACLWSLADMHVDYAMEIMVVDNSSDDVLPMWSEPWESPAVMSRARVRVLLVNVASTMPVADTIFL